MPRTVTNPLRTTNTLDRRFLPIYAATLLLIFHTFVVAYINSSYLEQFIPTQSIGLIYIGGSALTVLIFLCISRVLHLVGNFGLTLVLLLLDLLSVLGMAGATSITVAVPLFILHLIIVPLIVFNLDVFMEEHLGNNEGVTGSKRGLLLTLSSAIGAVSPFISSELVAIGNGSFAYAYLMSAAALIPVIAILLYYFRDFIDPPYTEIKVFSALKQFWSKPNIRSVFIAHFMLQVFFMCMVVFTPLYLTQQIGLTWAEFGIVIFFAQLAYVIFEYPIGYIADNYIGEKEMMALGFFILAIATAWISFITVTSVVVWSVVMFTTRVGASLVEVTTESYFFKQTKSTDAQIISFFRITRPLAYVLGATVTSIALWFLPFNLLFVVVAFMMIPALFSTMSLVDSR